MHLRIAILLIGTAAATRADDNCPTFVSQGPTCFFSTNVVNLYFGTLTLLTPSGTVSVVNNIVTASTGVDALSQSSTTTLPTPPDIIALYPTLVTQLQSDPQSTFGQIPSFVYPGLAGLANSNGLGDIDPMSALIDPAAADFDTELANVGGAYATLSDTGFQQLPFDPAYCTYIDNLIPGYDCEPPAPGGTAYIFSYTLGPQTVGVNTFTSFVDFQILERQVTEQLIAPEPGTLALCFGAFLTAASVKRAAASLRSRRHPST